MVIVDSRGSGGGAERNGDVAVVAPVLCPEQEHFSLQPRQEQKLPAQPLLDLTGGIVRVRVVATKIYAV